MNVDELFRFEENEIGYVVAEYLQKKNPVITEIEIPAYYNNKKVYAIGIRAFYEAEYLTSITLPDNIYIVCRAGFAGCTSLENIKLSDSISEIRGGVFCRCYALKTIILPLGLCEISFAAFSDCYNLENVMFTSDKSVRIEEDAFRNCSKLPPEFQIYSLVGYNNIDLPFRKDPFGDFDWEIALDENVFKMAVKHNNFSVLTKELFRHIVDLNSIDYLTQAEHLFDEYLITKTLNYSIERGNTEMTAYLLDLKKRKFGFEHESEFNL